MAKEELKIEFTLTDDSLKRLFSAFEEWRWEGVLKRNAEGSKVQEQKEAESFITLDQMKTAAKNVANQLGDKALVKKTIAEFAASSTGAENGTLSDVAPSVYTELLEALDNLLDEADNG